MSIMRKQNIIAIFCADIHLQHTVPPARSNEESWYAAMLRPLDELSQLVMDTQAPIFCAGDVFEKWNSNPEIINFAIDGLPLTLHGIPGQHDLPYHNLDDIKRSAYWTLVESNVLLPLDEEEFDDIVVTGVPWGVDIPRAPVTEKISVLIAHKYVWTKRIGGYPGAPIENRVDKMEDQLKGYNVAVFGDNHIAFQAKSGDCQVVNCGCLIPRKSDEKKLKPSVWLLMDDGSIERHCLNMSEDKWLAEESKGEETSLVGMDKFVQELTAEGDDSLDFREAVYRYMDENKIKGKVRQLVLESMGE